MCACWLPLFLEEQEQGLLTPKDKVTRLETTMRLSQADPVPRHVMSCARFDAVSLLAKQFLES